MFKYGAFDVARMVSLNAKYFFKNDEWTLSLFGKGFINNLYSITEHM